MREFRKTNSFRYKSGLTYKEKAALIEKQGFKCLICGIDFRTIPDRNIHIDHSHDTGKVRGILCHRCNMGIGLFDENRENLKRAMEYV